MGILDFIKGELLEIIEWTDDSRDTLSWQFPDDDKAIKRGAQLIVRESQVAQFVYLGEFGDTFGPGKHSLTTDNIPVLTRLKSWPFGFESPFKADVYFVTTRLFTGNKWGTSNPVMLRDNDFGIVRVRAFGTYDFKIVEPKTFLREVAGSDHNFRLDEFSDTMRSRIVSIFTDAIASAKIPVLDVASRYTELGDALLPLINPAVTAKYGLEITSFIVENVSVPPEVEQAIDKRSQHGRGRQSERLREVPDGARASKRPAGAAARRARRPNWRSASAWRSRCCKEGLAGGTRHTAPRRPRLPELLGPADAARALGVSEADVMAVLESGELKGKKIGASWRISRARARRLPGVLTLAGVTPPPAPAAASADGGRDHRAREARLPGLRRAGRVEPDQAEAVVSRSAAPSRRTASTARTGMVRRAGSRRGAPRAAGGGARLARPNAAACSAPAAAR